MTSDTPERFRSRFEALDERFTAGGDRWMERLWTGARWTEGPAYFPAGRYLVFSDIPNDRLLRWDEITGTTGVFRQPSRNANGHTVDRQGRLVSCEHDSRSVTRTEADGSVTVLADRYDGKRLNSPNDIVEHSGGTLWFTDPAYGIDTDYEGHHAVSEIGACHLYRLDPGTGQVTLADGSFARPNGLAFSADERLLYVSDSERRELRVFTVGGDLALSGGDVLATCTSGTFDGVRVDDRGQIWASAGDGLHCFSPDGTLLGKLHVPEVVANFTFGGPKRNQLFICATSSLYSVMVNVTGAVYPA